MNRIIILLILVLIHSNISAQKVIIDVKDQALSEVLIDLRDTYDFQLSFNNNLLSQYSVSVNKSFQSKDRAIEFLLRKFPLNYQKSNEVYLIFPEEKIVQHRVFGQILDKESLEPLPFSHLTINDLPMATDEHGNFSFTSHIDSTFRILASHLGYFIHDTLINEGPNQNILLTAASTDLPEIIVTDKIVQTFIRMGNQSGNLKLNHKIAGFLPTNNDNSVFELLRLQPGILAAGEQKDDLIIWGSYEGESQVLFDNITLWGLKNFYDDIGAVNPLVVKNIEVLKGGFDARYGDRVGGIVHITGKNGSKLKPTLNLTLNNITASGSYEQPIGKRSSVLVAFRQTYYNLFKDEQIKYGTSNISLQGQTNQNTDTPSFLDLNVAPDYKFHDLNFKFSTNWENGDNFSVSLMGGEDRYSYDITTESFTNAKKHKFEGNDQFGGSINYGKVWNNGNTSSISLSRSELKTRTSDVVSISRIRTDEEFFRRDDKSRNKIMEHRATLKNTFVFAEDQNFETGINYINNEVDLKEDSLDINILHIKSKADRLGYYFQNNLNVSNGISIKAGFLANYPIKLKKLYWEPRISLSLQLTESIAVNGAWGLYKQFITKSSVLSANGSYRYIWVGADEKEIPVLESVHHVMGASYHKNGFTLSLEGYYKKTDGHTRYYKFRNEGNISTGQSKSSGLDVFAKKDIGNHTLWVSYSLSKTTEKFDYFNNIEYRRALHDQRHEIKTAGLLALKPFYISANYIYGSGFPIYSQRQEVVAEPDYTRLDAAIIYKFAPKKIKCELGVLFHNILDTNNITYESYERIPLNQINSISIYTETVPTSVRLYFKISI
ncbi:TonB-dependent receptor plug domain-containing protein [Labilibaculum sp. DW002]|uniref:TonB-dependent receptor plug domain-containing protein n=1 Tax=Paralabilibaculum antarcticum TaxID=2912572 RepID=A0ABT5VXR3_9BACT|nr:TonB-dependent receptor plug domain-containing protein [Labilibaculum sp. DW002]MDE5420200.1 TonB-dependent receptor plug domain-containing protein [Labilibaculum sp. DW002]